MTLLAIIEHDATSDIRVIIQKYHGRRYVNVQEFVDFDPDFRRPSRNVGISFRPAQLVAVIRALKQAEAVLRADGFIKGETA